LKLDFGSWSHSLDFSVNVFAIYQLGITPAAFRRLPREEQIEALATYEAREHMLAWESQLAAKEQNKNKKGNTLQKLHERFNTG